MAACKGTGHLICIALQVTFKVATGAPYSYLCPKDQARIAGMGNQLMLCMGKCVVLYHTQIPIVWVKRRDSVQHSTRQQPLLQML